MTNGQFERHQCEPNHRATKKISVDEIIDLTENGKKSLLGIGLDGVHYLIKVEKPCAIPFITSRRKVTDFPHGERTDEDETEPLASAYKGMTLYTRAYINTV